LHAAVQSHVSYGVLAGLLVGKPLGILVFGWGAERLHLASLPARLRWRDVAVIGVLGGIGFTVSIFITELAFGGDDSLATAAKIGIFAASILAAIAGWLMARATVGRRAAS